MSSTTETPAPAPPARPNPFARLAGLVTSPADTIRSIADRPDWLVPLLLILVVSVVLNFVALPRLDVESQLRDQFGEQGMTEEQIDEAIERMEAFRKFAAPITAISVVISLLALTALYLLISKIFGGEGTFKQFFAVTNYAWIPQMVKGILVVLLLLRAGTISPERMGTLLKSNLGFLADPEEQAMLFAVLSSIDVFNFATLALMAIGYGQASRFGKEKGAVMVIATYVIWILVRVGFAAMRS